MQKAEELLSKAIDATRMVCTDKAKAMEALRLREEAMALMKTFSLEELAEVGWEKFFKTGNSEGLEE